MTGNRDKAYLVSLSDKKNIEKKGEAVLKALEGNYNDTYLFMLEQNLNMWEKYQEQITIIDNRLGQLLQQMSGNKGLPITDSKPKSVRHHAPKIEGLQQMLIRLCGVNATSVSGINDYTLLRLVGETGTDMMRFETNKPMLLRKSFLSIFFITENFILIVPFSSLCEAT